MSWVADLTALIHSRWDPGDSFCLEDVYEFEDELWRRHPGNSEVRSKIRQVLQELRDGGYIWFVDDSGEYKLVR